MPLSQIAKVLILTGVAIVIAGAILLAASRLGLGRLPGDFSFRRGNVQFYFPLATSILLSLILTLAFWIFRR